MLLLKLFKAVIIKLYILILYYNKSLFIIKVYNTYKP